MITKGQIEKNLFLVLFDVNDVAAKKPAMLGCLKKTKSMAFPVLFEGLEIPLIWSISTVI